METVTFYDDIVGFHVSEVMNTLSNEREVLVEEVRRLIEGNEAHKGGKNFMLGATYYNPRGDLLIPSFSILNRESDNGNTVFFTVNCLAADDTNYSLTCMHVRNQFTGDWQFETFLHSGSIPDEVDLITDEAGEYIARACLDLLPFHDFAVYIMNFTGLLNMDIDQLGR
jgi:hypothetical protein